MDVEFLPARLVPDTSNDTYSAQDFEALQDGDVTPFNYSAQTGDTILFASIIGDFAANDYGYDDFELLPDGAIIQYDGINVTTVYTSPTLPLGRATIIPQASST